MKNHDRIGLLSSPQNMSRWKQFQVGYSMWVFLVALTAFALFAYFDATTLPSLMFLMGVPLLWYIKGVRRFWAPALVTGGLLLIAFIRSDFVVMLALGKGIGEAFTNSTRYFVAPIIMWFIYWAILCAAKQMSNGRATQVMTWFGYLIIGLAAVQLLEALSNMSIRNGINMTFFHGHRPEMMVVKVSNTNTLLLILFWPLALFFANQRKFLPIVAMAGAIAIGSIVTDTNAQLLALGLSFLVFLTARHWPRWLSYRHVTPERVMAVLTAFAVLVFPALVLNLIAFGFDHKIKTELLPSWAARIDIWTFTVERCLEKPIWGWGYESSRLFEPDIPNHPHNMSLQAWLELGVPGLVCLAVLWAIMFWIMGTKSDFVATPPVVRSGLSDLKVVSGEVAFVSVGARVRPYMMALGTAFYFINTVSFGLWRMWFYSIGALAVAILILVVKAVKEDMRLHNLL